MSAASTLVVVAPDTREPDARAPADHERAPESTAPPARARVVGLAWRKQPSAVQAIEERDGVRFYVDRTSPLKPIQLIRTPGFGGDFLRLSGSGP